MNRKGFAGNEQGFTLMEIMVVVAILALIIGAVAVNIGGANKQAKKSVTLTAMSSLDSALERFRLDFNAYPTAINATEGQVKNGGDTTEEEKNWEMVSKALSATGLTTTGDRKQLFPEELQEVLRMIGKEVKENTAMELEQSFTGPYIKSRDGIVRDGFKNTFILWVDNASGLYRLYSKGANGRDNGGDPKTSDDLVSEGSQLEISGQ